MQPFLVRVLGCGSAKPTPRHNASSQIVELRNKIFMIDCGEGTQTYLHKARFRLGKLGHIFISHLHGDHCFGLIGLISSLGLMGRTAPLHVYAPEALGPMLRAQINLFCEGLDYEVFFHAVDTTRMQVVYEDRSLTVKTIPLQHRIPCCGYLFTEKAGAPHIRRDMIDFYHIPISQIYNIKGGADWVTPDGQVVENRRLVTPPDAVRSYAYCSDTSYMPELHEMVRGVDLLYHESTYGSEFEHLARAYHHSTAAQAAMVARDAGAGQLMLGHYSARYDDETPLLNEARAIFPNTILANEGLEIPVEVKKN